MPVKSEAQQEWRGQTSEKFNTWKAHLPAPVPNQDGFHPFANVEQRKHFAEVRSEESKAKETSQKTSFVERFASDKKPSDSKKTVSFLDT